jgi:uncharacterized damage-inducible protein DinB
MLTEQRRRTYIEAIRQLPEWVEHAVVGFDEAALTAVQDGSWTVAQLVHHLADSNVNGYIRMKAAATMEHPTLMPFDQDAWAASPDATHPRVEESLLLLRGLHRRWTDLLDSLPDDAWTRTAHHPEVGMVSLDDLLAHFAEHGEEHVADIRAQLEKES